MFVPSIAGAKVGEGVGVVGVGERIGKIAGLKITTGLFDGLSVGDGVGDGEEAFKD